MEFSDLFKEGGIGIALITVVVKVLRSQHRENKEIHRRWEKSMEGQVKTLNDLVKRLMIEFDTERASRSDLSAKLTGTMQHLREHNHALEKIAAALKGHMELNAEKQKRMETEIVQIARDLQLVRTKKG
jgi:hypothetical protein